MKQLYSVQIIVLEIDLKQTAVFRSGEPRRRAGHRFQNPCDGMRNARLKREDAFSHAMIIVSSAMVSSS
jgi:hypothetical protein